MFLFFVSQTNDTCLNSSKSDYNNVISSAMAAKRQRSDIVDTPRHEVFGSDDDEDDNGHDDTVDDIGGYLRPLRYGQSGHDGAITTTGYGQRSGKRRPVEVEVRKRQELTSLDDMARVLQ
jgi:hypothetical protein